MSTRKLRDEAWSFFLHEDEALPGTVVQYLLHMETKEVAVLPTGEASALLSRGGRGDGCLYPHGKWVRVQLVLHQSAASLASHLHRFFVPLQCLHFPAAWGRPFCHMRDRRSADWPSGMPRCDWATTSQMPLLVCAEGARNHVSNHSY